MLRQVRDQNLTINTYSDELFKLRLEMRQRHRQVFGTLFGCAMLVGGMVSLGLAQNMGLGWGGISLIGGLLVFGGVVTIFFNRPEKVRD